MAMLTQAEYDACCCCPYTKRMVEQFFLPEPIPNPAVPDCSGTPYNTDVACLPSDGDWDFEEGCKLIGPPESAYRAERITILALFYDSACTEPCGEEDI
jgi:hypothetical protein